MHEDTQPLQHSRLAQIWHKHWYLITFVVILVLSAMLRLYKLGDVPHGMTWDEAAIGYNGYAVITTRRDEFLKLLPISFKSFGDYKAPFAIYLNGLFTVVFGLNLWAVRLPFALGGIAMIAGMMLLARHLFRLSLPQTVADLLSLATGFFLISSPWHLHFSRAGFESGLAVCFLVWGIWSLLQFFATDPKEKRALLLWGVSSALLLSVTMYTYHSAKIVVPLLGLAIIGAFFHKVWGRLQATVVPIVVGGLSLLPLLVDSLFAKGSERLSQVSIFNEPLSVGEKLQLAGANFIHHFSVKFLLFGETTTLRHGDGKWGVLFVSTLFLVVVSLAAWIVSLMQDQKRKTTVLQTQITTFFEHVKLPVLLGIAWILIGFIPGAIGKEIPHANRGLLALPGFLLLATSGLYLTWNILQVLPLNKKVSGSKGEENLLPKSVIGCLFFLHVCLSLAYIHSYFTTFAAESANDFKDGYLGAMYMPTSSHQ